jgi:hypothetical protein
MSMTALDASANPHETAADAGKPLALHNLDFEEEMSMSNMNDAGGKNGGSRGTSTSNQTSGSGSGSGFSSGSGSSGSMGSTSGSSSGSLGGGSMSGGSSSGIQPLGMSSGSDSGHHTGEGVLALLQKFGIDEAVVNSLMTQWRGQLSDKVSSKIQEGDLLELLDSAREMAKNSGSKLKNYSQANPAMFYSGVVAIMAGAGLLAAAAKADVSATTDENTEL